MSPRKHWKILPAPETYTSHLTTSSVSSSAGFGAADLYWLIAGCIDENPEGQFAGLPVHSIQVIGFRLIGEEGYYELLEYGSEAFLLHAMFVLVVVACLSLFISSQSTRSASKIVPGILRCREKMTAWPSMCNGDGL